MKHFKIALRFLTRYPVAPDEAFGPGDFGRATGYYPLVGFFAGLDLALLRWLTLQDHIGLHYPLWAMVLLLFWVWASDSLHLDGLADTADALASRREGPEFSAVLHDSRVGAFGAAAVTLALLAKYVWLASLPMQNWWFLPLPFIFSRLHSSLACQIRPYAGNQGSLSSMFIGEAAHSDLNRAAAWSGACFLALVIPSVYFGFCSSAGAIEALAVCGLGLLLGRFVLRLPVRRQGGISGDLIGWSQVITETAIAFGLSLALVR
jgi:adenosylcobinamide-GDP ribazoletransferase